MNAFEGIIEDLNKSTFDSVHTEFKVVTEFYQKLQNYVGTINNAIEIYKNTGVAPKCNFKDWETCEILEPTDNSNERQQRNSIKENIQPKDNDASEYNSTRSRPRRNAFKEAAESINKQCSLSLNTKLRRPDSHGHFENVYIKKEKLSICEPNKESGMSQVRVKIEKEEMPAPTKPAPRRKKQKKSESKFYLSQQKIKEDVDEEVQVRESDVIILDPPIPTTVNLLHSDHNENRKTETITKNKAKSKKWAQRPQTPPVDEDDGLEVTHVNGDLTTDTNYEDALSTVDNNATYVTSKSPNNNMDSVDHIPLNATVVIEKPKYVTNEVVALKTVEDLMTDDESEEEGKQKIPTKSVEQSPVKKMVQVFEKLRQDANTIPIRVTRTKTRADAQQAEQQTAEASNVKSNVKEKARLFTPTTKFIPAVTSTSVKVTKSNISSNDSLLPMKSSTAVKATPSEYRKRREKEQEAPKKREALLLAQIEEKRRKREEKQLKAQQQRQVLEKEKLKVLELQKLKDERHRQLLAEQEEKKQKQKEELEKKRVMAKLRAVQEKQKEQEKRLEEQRKVDEMAAKLAKQDEEMAKLLQKQKLQREQKQQQPTPVYMVTAPPLLPTHDCYDSDHEEYGKSDIKLPSWERNNNIKEMLHTIIAAGEAVKNSFFSRQAQTPDLRQIFEVIQPEKLKRSSSAIWVKPPRFTMLPSVNEYIEDVETDED